MLEQTGKNYAVQAEFKSMGLLLELLHVMTTITPLPSSEINATIEEIIVRLEKIKAKSV